MDKNKKTELKILKTILWIYIVMCLIIAGLNYGYSSKVTPKTATLISWIWHFYENWVKTLFIFIGSILTLRIIGASNRTVMRKRNLIGFTVSALIVHISAPLILNNKELYFFTMPLPWTTTPLQMLYSNSLFYISRFSVWGVAGMSAALIFYVCVCIVVIVGTLMFGRRWQCSTLCLFNGFASEVFAPAIPLIGKNKNVKPLGIKVFSIIRWLFLLIALFFTVWWILFLSGTPVFGNYQIISKAENYKYLSAELLMAMFFWVAFIGRGYCYYCPLGTVLSLLGRVAGQQISTDNTNCIQCGKCNVACPMTIDIKSSAKTGDAVKNLRCVGCGHCVDVCPTKTLSYSTKFLRCYRNKKNHMK